MIATGSPFFDLSRLLSLRAAVRDLDPSGPPAMHEIEAPRLPSRRRMALLPGSFNPVTNAHVAMADSALQTGRIDALDYVLATRTVDKERVERASLADRLICLSELVKGRRREGVTLVNRGLYVDQAEIVRRSWPSLEELWFVVGYDKIVQIFDPRYYQDRDAALQRLFGLASFLVAPRADADPLVLRDFLDHPENRPYASGVVSLDLAPAYRTLSSTRVREAGRRGEPPPDDVPPIVARFVNETGAYAPPLQAQGGEEVDRYAIREMLVDAAETGRIPRLSPDAFQALVARLSGLDPEARRRREFLRRGDVVRALVVDQESGS